MKRIFAAMAIATIVVTAGYSQEPQRPSWSEAKNASLSDVMHRWELLPGNNVGFVWLSCFSWGGRYGCTSITENQRFFVVWTDQFIGKEKELLDQRCLNMAQSCRMKIIAEITSAGTNMEGTGLIFEAARIWGGE
jgi:hypothetical protein